MLSQHDYYASTTRLDSNYNVIRYLLHPPKAPFSQENRGFYNTYFYYPLTISQLQNPVDFAVRTPFFVSLFSRQYFRTLRNHFDTKFPHILTICQTSLFVPSGAKNTFPFISNMFLHITYARTCYKIQHIRLKTGKPSRYI